MEAALPRQHARQLQLRPRPARSSLIPGGRCSQLGAFVSGRPGGYAAGACVLAGHSLPSINLQQLRPAPPSTRATATRPRMHCAIGAEVPADATGPGACGKGQRLKRYGTVQARLQLIIITARPEENKSVEER